MAGVSDGGRQELLGRLKDPAVRARIKKEFAIDDWDNVYFEAGGPQRVLVMPNSANLKKFNGKTLAEVAAAWGKSPEDTFMEFIVAYGARTDAVNFFGSEDDLKTALVQSWTSVGLDFPKMSLDGPLYFRHFHSRGFGSMPLFLGSYIRDQRLLPIEAAIRKITFLPAQREHLERRGLLQPGFSRTSPFSIPQRSSTTPLTSNPINFRRASTSSSSTVSWSMKDENARGSPPGASFVAVGMPIRH
jgi:N-acyl-D-aspartate/D-glutamate deacylase